MSDSNKKIKNPEYLWACRIAFWVAVLFNIPLFFFDTYKAGSALGNTITIFLHCYLAAGSYILGYRLNDQPKWSRYLVPKKWIVEWQYLVYTDPESIKSNRRGLLAVIGGATLLMILLFAILSEKF
jgi:uncharacterized membrane-anchored protein YitT (DUF2179 family)